MRSPFLSSLTERALHGMDIVLRRQLRLGQNKFLRKIFLKPYRKLINCHGLGVLMKVGGCVPARMPAEYAWRVVEDYEPETVAKMKEWMERMDSPLLVDLGCSLGFITCAGLFSNLKASVVAIDSDIESLKATQLLCSYAPDVGERLSFVWGFVSNEPTKMSDFRQANQTALKALEQKGLSGDPTAIHYICLDSATDTEKTLPHHSLDYLFPPLQFLGTPILIKCDVEGAEFLVLKGGEQLLAKLHPALLMSVHPWALPKFGVTKEDVRSFLLELGYEVAVIAVDHEEHWWCEFKPKSC